MAKNQELENSVLSAMSSFLINSDPSFKMLCDDEDEVGKSVIESMGRLQVDELSKVRFHMSRIIGYGYDFKGDVDGTPAKEMYENAVKNTKESVLGKFGETFLSEGIDDERYGWYLASI